MGDGDTPTPGYGVTNIGAGIRFATGGQVHDLTISVDNLFDQVYRDNLSVVKDFIPQPGRAFRLGYELLYYCVDFQGLSKGANCPIFWSLNLAVPP